MYTRDIVYDGKWATNMRNSDVVFRRTFIGNVAEVDDNFNLILDERAREFVYEEPNKDKVLEQNPGWE